MVFCCFKKRSASKMANRRSTSSPGRRSLMSDVLDLVAEPGSSSVHKKKPNVSCSPKDGKVTNHDYCDVCSGGGEIVCCDKCPKSYHLKCHSPSINALPDGEWLCRECVVNENGENNSEVPSNDVDIKTVLKRKIDFLGSYDFGDEEFLREISIRPKYNVKLPSRKQLGKGNLIRKADRCFVCNRSVLRGRLLQCDYCLKLYHLNCLDPPIRDWDHSMKFQCPLHNKFFELVYPTIFTPDCGIRSDSVTMKRQRCELVNLPVNTIFNIPSNVDVLYDEPEENIPTTKTSSLNILCDIASFELELINSNHSINNDDNISKYVSEKFLACQRIKMLQKNECFLRKQPTASLSCLSVPINISIKKNSFTIGRSFSCDLSLSPYGKCEYISDVHVTITYDSNLGDFLAKNHSKYGIIVDDVSYFGNHRPKEVSNRELKVINSQVKKYINRRRQIIQKGKLLRIIKISENENVIKYANGKKKFDYRLMSKYYSKKFKNIQHSYQKIKCKCPENVIPKDGCFEQAILRNNSIISIGCIKFVFVFNEEEVPKNYAVKVPKECVKKVPKVCKESVSNALLFVEKSSNTHTVEISEINVKQVSKANVEEQCNMCVEVPEVYTNREIPEVFLEGVSNESTEGKIVSVLTGDKISKILDQTQNGAHRSYLSEITSSFTSLNNRCDSLEEQNIFKQVYLDNPSDCEFSDSHLEMNCVPNDIELDKDNNSIQTSCNDSNMIFNNCGNPILDNGDDPSLNDDVDPSLNINGDPTLNICGDPTLNDVQMSGPTGLESHERCRMDVVNGVQSCYGNDLIQEVDSCEIVGEEILFELGYNDTDERVDSNNQCWIEEIYVEDDGNSANQQSQLMANYNVHGYYETEHMYCAQSPMYEDEIPTIVISSDDE